jgi:uncharacterized protein (TIGR02246 family)
MKKILAVVGTCLFLTASVEAQKAPAAKAGGDALGFLRKDWVAAANAKDAAKLTSLYADDAVLMPSNAPMAKGHAAIQAVWKGLMDQGARDIVLTPVGGSVSGDLAYESGTYTFTMNGAGGAAASDKGKYILVAHRGADGKWWIHDDIFNSDLPCSGGAGAK